MQKKLKHVALKNGFVFNGEKIYVQSMLNVPSSDLEKNLLQAKRLQEAGCDIIRVAVPMRRKVSRLYLKSVKKVVSKLMQLKK